MAAKKARTAAAEDSDHDEIYQAIDKLQEVQAELEKVNAEAREKIMKVEQKYKEKREPVYAKRNQIISCIPDFWLTTFLYHPVLENMLTDNDQKIFGYLDSVEVEDFPDPRKGYCITFTFKPNPYFENTKLTKTIKFSDGGTLKSVGTGILWKQGKGPLGERNNNTSGNKRPLPWQSFFNWFEDPLVEMNQDKVAKIIKEEIWPNPVENLNNRMNMMILKTTRTRKRTMMVVEKMMVAEETWPEKS